MKPTKKVKKSKRQEKDEKRAATFFRICGMRPPLCECISNGGTYI